MRLLPLLSGLAVAGAQTPRAPSAPVASTTPVALSAGADTFVVHGLYVNRWVAQNKPRIRALIQFARETGINAMVVDLKDEFGLNYHPTDSVARRYVGNGGAIPDVRWLVDTLRANGIMPIARLVVFKDSVAARARPDWTILAPDSQPWRDKQKLTWVNPYNPAVRDYDLRVAVEVAKFGFAEIQFDYIRFPEPYTSLPKQVFPGAGNTSKPELLAMFLRDARARLAPMGVRCTADVFGMTTSVRGALEVGQQWEPLASAADVLLPMVYPSHYPVGFMGIAHPNGSPYEIVKDAVKRAVQRDSALGLHGETVRPYLQAFTLGKPAYGNAELSAQIRAAYEAGARGWILWNPGSKYEAFKDALVADMEHRAGEAAHTLR